MVKQWQQTATEATDSAEKSTVMFDFGAAGPAEWLQNGVSFGLQPAQPGELMFTNDPTNPVHDVVRLPGARRDLTWKGFEAS